MRINGKGNKRTIEFEKIREGTVLMNGGETYIKGSGGVAVNLETGKAVFPVNDPSGGWDECYIYPGASLSLD